MITDSIAIDGPAGAGKSTVARELARRLGIHYLETGALYRALALYCDRHATAFSDEPAVTALLGRADIRVEYRGDSQRVLLDGEDCTGLLRTERIGGGASAVSRYPVVRDKITELSRAVAREYRVVMDGRDICTNVLRETPHKFFLTASSTVRAQRRLLQLEAIGQQGDFDVIRADIEARDKQDSERAYMPLICREDTLLIDTGEMSADEVVTRMLREVQR